MKNIKAKGLLMGALLSIAFLGACSKEETKGEIIGESITTSEEKTSDGDEVLEENYSIKDDGFFKEIITGNEEPKVKTEVEYATNWSNKEWDGIVFDINRVKVVEVEQFRDESETGYKGLLALRYTLANKEDEISVHPNDATIILNNGKEIKATHFADYWEDVFAKNEKKTGYVHFKFDEIEDIKQIKSIKLSFDGHKKDQVEKTVSHQYEVELPLTLSDEGTE